MMRPQTLHPVHGRSACNHKLFNHHPTIAGSGKSFTLGTQKYEEGEGPDEHSGVCRCCCCCLTIGHKQESAAPCQPCRAHPAALLPPLLPPGAQ